MMRSKAPSRFKIGATFICVFSSRFDEIGVDHATAQEARMTEDQGRNLSTSRLLNSLKQSALPGNLSLEAVLLVELQESPITLNQVASGDVLQLA
jgi:hypothetical protein